MKEKDIKNRYKMIVDHLNEKTRRLWCANESIAIGRGGISLIAKATGISRTTITEGEKELKGKKETTTVERVRRLGGGRKRIIDKDQAFKKDLEQLVEPATRGDPERPLKWTSKSLRKLAKELNQDNKRGSYNIVAQALKELGYSLQSNRKTKEGGNHPDRNAQFEFINEKTKQFLLEGTPVISVDSKKKENLGELKNNGKEYAPKGNPVEVEVYDFPNKELGKVVPYGVYEILRNKGWVNVGVSADTAQFAVESIRRWWYKMGKKAYSKAKSLYINADGGGSNGHRPRLWKSELQKLATELKIEIHVSHFPPGTSKWNKIEHRMFSFISKNWRGKPLLDRATVVKLISNTTTEKGLAIKACLDKNKYMKKIKISDEDFAKINIKPDKFHGEWNYVIYPKL